MNLTSLKKNVVACSGVLCAVAGLVLTGCERHDNSTPQGAAQDAADQVRGAAKDTADRTRDAINNATSDTNRTDVQQRTKEAADKATSALKKTANEAGDALEKAGEKLKEAGK